MIKLDHLLTILKEDKNFREIIDQGTYFYNGPDFTFDQLSYDSRKVSPTTLFFVKGANFKKEFLEGAVAAGLSYYVAEKDYEVGIPAIIVTDVKKAMSLAAMEFYDHPEKKLKLLALTGTKGKTTTAYFSFYILKQSFKPALLSTMHTSLDGENFFKSELTTPESIDLIEMMAKAVENGRTHLIMEVSSQAYLLHRVYGLTFDVGVFLNISPDHIGPIEHPSFEDYFYHKRMLMENSRHVIVNAGMDHFTVLKEQVEEQSHDFYGADSTNFISDSSAFAFKSHGQIEADFKIQLIGLFNQENALAASLACQELGASLDDCIQGVAATRVPGRMEVLEQSNGAKVFVDYAHNGDSVKKLLSVVLAHQTGQVSLVLGATGNKGESRRKDFGQLLNHYPDLHVILTADDPNFEDPAEIAKEIASYIHYPVNIQPDRIQAIKEAMAQTKGPNDAVIIAGKGADAYQIVQGKKEDYAGDYAIAEQFL